MWFVLYKVMFNFPDALIFCIMILFGYMQWFRIGVHKWPIALEGQTGLHIKDCQLMNSYFSWFQTLATFWRLYAFFWVILRCLNFICHRFKTLCLVGIPTHLWRWNRQECSETLAYKIQMPGNYAEESIQRIVICFSFHVSDNQMSFLLKV